MKKILWLLLLLPVLFCACGSEDDSPVVAYAKENWSQFAPFVYQEESNHLTISQSSTLSYEDACLYGKNVYSEDLAPETYLPAVRMVRLEIGTACETPDLSVTLQCLSTDGEVIFSVSNDGEISTCWK